MMLRALLLLALDAAAAFAQAEVVPDSATVVPGVEYRAGGLTRFLVGNGYRGLWTDSIRVPVLDLDHFAGGLTPMRVGQSGGQTWSLHVHGADGEEYVLRSVDKHVKLAPEVSSGVPAWLLRDQISAGFATGALIVAPLLTAARVPHEDPLLRVIPDSPRLGEYRQRFAGLLVWVEHRPRTDDTAKVAKTENMLAAISSKVSERLDSRGYLTARLMDIYVGDWDRGHLQWFWERVGDKHDHLWRAIPHDRDWAFANHDGLLYNFLRPTTPWFVKYEPNYPNLIGLEANAWGQDRRLLQDLEAPVWDSTAAWLTSVLTDSVIDDAVRQLPPPERARYGARLTEALRKRRDKLPAVARSFFATVAAQADVHTVAVPSIVDIRRSGDTVEIRARSRGTSTGTYYDRRFVATSTREIRLYLDGGPDSIAVSGDRNGMLVRLIAGADGDVLVDPIGDAIQVYDGGHPMRIATGQVATNHASYTQPTLPAGTPEADRQPVSFLLRDAGSWCVPTNPMSLSSASGFRFESGLECQAYGFRRIPWAIDNAISVGFMFGPGGIVGSYTGSVRAVDGSPIWSFHVDGASAEYTWFYGVGNETTRPRPDDDFRSREARVTVSPSVAIQPVPQLTLTIAPEMRYRRAEQTLPSYFAETHPYGSGSFGVVDGRVSMVLDTRDVGSSAASGLRFELSGRGVPGAWDAVQAYGTGHAEIAGYLATPLAPLALDLRAGGDKVWGIAPYQDLASIGGSSTVRGFFPGRFSGDAAVYEQSELFLTLGQITLIAPSTVGILGLNDVGRVFAAGEHSSSWHDGYGGGVWAAFVARRYLVTLTIAHSVEHTVVDAGFGLGW
jgi:hypothetical protein